MSWIVIIVLALLALYLTFKAVGLFVKLAIWAVVLVAAWYLLAPHLGVG